MQTESRQVAVFDEVAAKYEFLNSVMTAGQDRKWRETLIRASQSALGREPQDILDLASGTGDVPRMMAERWPQAVIVGTDPNENMLAVAKAKSAEGKRRQPNWGRIRWEKGRAEFIDAETDSIDLVSIAFGFRNVPAEARTQALQEIFRVLRPGGVLAILELGLPKPGMARSLYRFLLANAMPHVAGLFSPKEAYKYLAQSIQEFPEPTRVRELLKSSGFLPFAPKPLTGGMCWLFIGRKPLDDRDSTKSEFPR